jgi:NAD(P)-dependent dehydrogenase (short-subunit alcohol dehydrogenase family)
MSSPQTWFITGVSTGFGLELAKLALEQGHTVAGTARRPADLAAFEALAPGRAHAFHLDLTEASTVPGVVAQVIERLGQVDVVVNNAGYGTAGAIEEVTDEQIRRQMEVNFFGALAVMRAFLPYLRRQRKGWILNLSSIAGVLANPGLGLYCASKFALEAVSEALAKEVAPLGIKVVIIEPGPFRTDFAGRSLVVAPAIPDYAATAGAMRRYFEQANGRQAGDPVKAARAMLELVNMENPPLRLAMGNRAVDLIRNKLESQLAELAQHESWARSLDYDA